MTKSRMEAFSDGVIAIIITIMVLELKVPHETVLSALTKLLPVFLGYALSFVFIGIYWVNHHHLIQVAECVSGTVLWANLHLLFWLSLIPFTTGWMGQNYSDPLPIALYGCNLLAAAIAYYILTKALYSYHDEGSTLVRALKNTFKARVSLLCYAVAIPLAFVNHWISYSLYLGVALWWLVPDRSMERIMEEVRCRTEKPS